MKLCMGCMNQMEDNLSVCPHCGFNETNLRQESYYLDPGTIIGGKYIVGRVLSYGGHTISYLGMNAEINQKVIVKEYLPSDFSTRSEGEKEVTIYSGDAKEQFENGLTNFLNEANRIQSLKNPEGIARVYDCVAENDTGYVISEYVQGHTLKEILAAGKKYSVKEAKDFISQILKGLCKVHPLDIIHCDISPETIMVTDSGEIKLLDFGATRYVTTANSKSLAIILKQGYAPEEQYRSRGVRGPWTDVYALGAVMYRMITGVVPQESVERTLVDELKEPSKLGVSIPENIENALMNALNVYQSDRTPSAEAFLKELNSPSVKRVKVKTKRNETGKFSVWAKLLVACLLCIVVAGGAFLLKTGLRDMGGNLGSEQTLVLEDFSGKTKEEAEKILKDHGYEITVKIIDTYNSDDTQNGKIYKQSVSPTNDLESEEHDGLEIKDGKVSGSLECYVYQNETIKYSEISGLNAYALSKTINIPITDEGHFEKLTEEDGNYFDITKIELKNGDSLSIENIKNGKSEDTIRVDDIKKIYYCANDFFFWEEFPDFVGKNINTLEKQDTYEKKSENAEPVKSRKTKFLKDNKSLVDDSYYTFNQEAGYIFDQTKESGETVDTSKESDYLLCVVGTRLTWSGRTGNSLKKELEKLGFSVKFIGSEDGNQQIEEVQVYDQDKGKLVEYFKKEDNITIDIKTKERETTASSPGGHGLH